MPSEGNKFRDNVHNWVHVDEFTVKTSAQERQGGRGSWTVVGRDVLVKSIL